METQTAIIKEKLLSGTSKSRRQRYKETMMRAVTQLTHRGRHARTISGLLSSDLKQSGKQMTVNQNCYPKNLYLKIESEIRVFLTQSQVKTTQESIANIEGNY